MLMAYEDPKGKFEIKDRPVDDTLIPARPIETEADAKRILALAQKARPEVRWVVDKGYDGRYRVRDL